MRARKSPLEPPRPAAFRVWAPLHVLHVLPVLLSVLALLPGCDSARLHDVTIVDGAGTTHLSTKTAFAEYVELPGVRNELRITLANYPVSCERWTAPRDGEIALSITIVTPAETRPAAASYPWSGLPPKEGPLKDAYALPKALLGPESRLFEPGGAARLSSVSLDLHGLVVGALAFEYPGDGSRPATRIDGGFEAKICRSTLAAH